MADWTEVIPNMTESEAWDRVGVVEGVYTSKKTGIGQNESNLYMIKTKDKDVSVWGSAVLDSRFELVPIGSEVRLQCLGKVKSEKTGREYYDYKLEYRPAPFQEAGAGSGPSQAAPEKKPGDVVPTELAEDEVDLDSIPF